MPERSLDIAAARRGSPLSACPGLFRIVPARDGGICRIRLPLGQLSAAKARAVAQSAARFGNGIVDATNRANLQIRGIRAADETVLTRALIAAGLGPTRPETDDIRNIMVSPTAGIDPLQEIDALPIARDLLAAIETGGAWRTLSPKFCLLVDGGEGVAAVDHPHDVWLASMPGGASTALGFAGVPPTRADDATPFAAVAAQHAVDAAAAALSIFAEAAAHDPEVTRFRHLIAGISRTELFDRVAERLPGVVERGAAVSSWRRRTPAPLAHVGVARQLQDGMAFIGGVPPLGRLSPGMLVRLAEIAEEFGNGNIRFTPWQSVIVPSVRRERAEAAVRALKGSGLTCDPADPLAAMVACSGSSGCARASSETKADALTLSRAVGWSAGAAPSIHLSGCARSCACAGVADFTLLAGAAGTYELFAKAAGGGRFGLSVAGDLTVAQAADRLREIGGGGKRG
jgi:precorrin-3B synthase